MYSSLSASIGKTAFASHRTLSLYPSDDHPHPPVLPAFVANTAYSDRSSSPTHGISPMNADYLAGTIPDYFPRAPPSKTTQPTPKTPYVCPHAGPRRGVPMQPHFVTSDAGTHHARNPHYMHMHSPRAEAGRECPACCRSCYPPRPPSPTESERKRQGRGLKLRRLLKI